jgi:hypothetical protein
MLFGRCTLWFPSLAQNLPWPVFPQHLPTPAPAMTFPVQTPAPPPPPAHHPWPVAANRPPVPQRAFDPTSFFRPRTLQPSHCVHECSTIQAQPIPNDGSERELKHGIGARPAAQAKVIPAPTQQVSLTREAPPPGIDSRMPAAHCKEDPFFQVFTAEKEKHEVRRSRLPEFHPSVPSTPTSAILPASTPSIPSIPAVPSDSVPLSPAVPADPVASIPTAPSGSTPSASVPAVSIVLSVSAAAAPASTAPVPVTTHPAQRQHQSTAEDQQLVRVSELQSQLTEGNLPLTTPAHILAASPAIRKDLVDELQVHQVEATGFDEVASVQVLTLSCRPPPPPQPPPGRSSLPSFSPPALLLCPPELTGTTSRRTTICMSMAWQ